MKIAAVSIALVVLVAAGILFQRYFSAALEERRAAEMARFQAELGAELRALHKEIAREAAGSKPLLKRVAKLEAGAASPATGPGSKPPPAGTPAPVGSGSKEGGDLSAGDAGEEASPESRLAEALEKLADPQLGRG